MVKLVGVQRFELWTSSTRTKRATGLRYTPNALNVITAGQLTYRPPGPRQWLCGQVIWHNHHQSDNQAQYRTFRRCAYRTQLPSRQARRAVRSAIPNRNRLTKRAASIESVCATHAFAGKKSKTPSRHSSLSLANQLAVLNEHFRSRQQIERILSKVLDAQLDKDRHGNRAGNSAERLVVPRHLANVLRK